MGHSSGFMQYSRQTSASRSLLERLGDRRSIHLQMAEPQLKEQAARCMDCGIPFCHTELTINGLSSGCPLHNLIPEWNDLVYRGLWREAYERLAKTNNFPEFTGLVCPALCEASCTLAMYDAAPSTATPSTVTPSTVTALQPTTAVAIKNIEYAIIERAFEEGWVRPETPRKRTGKHVAIVGSGPAGLACGDQLNRVGHNVTVFERADRIGGLLTYGIPNMKLEKGLVERRVKLVAAAGVRFMTNTEVGIDYPAARLRREFDAIVLCLGATQPRDLPVDGRGLKGVHFAVDFLRKDTKTLLDGARETISARDKDVIVIGGGDTGTDCVATAMRHGCRSLVQFEILPQPPAQRAPDNPWPQWPRVYCLDYGQEEAAARFGRDPRNYCVMTKQFVGDGQDGQGCLKEVHTVEVAWTPGENGGRPSLQEIPGTDEIWPAQLVLLAMGFLGPEGDLLAQLGIEQDARSNAKAAYGQYQTNVPGVFAAGDARRGQSLVVWAIHEGRGAARECDRYLMGETDLP
jgi:glutamate synthase (NADPH/NADH) small chain